MPFVPRGSWPSSPMKCSSILLWMACEPELCREYIRADFYAERSLQDCRAAADEGRMAGRQRAGRSEKGSAGAARSDCRYLSICECPVQLAMPTFFEQRRTVFSEQLISRVRQNLAELDRQLAGQKACSRLAVEGGWYAVLRFPRFVPTKSWRSSYSHLRVFTFIPGIFMISRPTDSWSSASFPKLGISRRALREHSFLSPSEVPWQTTAGAIRTRVCLGLHNLEDKAKRHTYNGINYF